MQKNDNIYGSSLLVVIIDKGKGSEILNYVLEFGIRGATAFRAHGTVPNKILRLLELGERQKEVIMIALPIRYENDIVQKLKDRFHFDRPGKGIVFSIALSAVYGSKHFVQEPLHTTEAINDLQYQAVMTIVDKGCTDNILDFFEDNGFPRGTVIDAHGSADKSNALLNLMLESEKDIFLVITTREEARRLTMLITDYLDLKSDNSGILAVLNLRQLVGVNFKLPESHGKNELFVEKNKSSYSAIFAIVENDMDEAVIKSAESAGSTGGTIIHARGSCPYGKAPLFTGVEPEREIVLIIAEDNKIPDICSKINKDLQLDHPGKGILLVAPLYDTIGLNSQ